MKTPSEIKALLEGPVNSIPTTFTRDGNLDERGIRNIIETGITGGSNVCLLTYGDSRFDYLSDAEVGRLTKLMVEQCRGRVLTVAATRGWWKGQAVEFAQYCADVGADVLMVFPGFHMRLSQFADFVDFHRAVAKVIPVMMIGYGPMPFLPKLLDEPNICCFKEDSLEDEAFAVLRHHGQRIKIMTGGILARHYRQWPFGSRAFMSWPSCFKPALANQYWQAVQANDTPTVHRIIEMECRLFDAARTFPNDWQGMWRGILEIHGVAQRYLRAPDPPASDEDIARLKTKLKELELL